MVHYYFIVCDIVTTFHRLDGFSFFFFNKEETERRQKGDKKEDK